MNKSKKIAVILSGCGVYDGSEIQEAILTLYSIAKHGGIYKVFAPDIPQSHVINHITGKVMDESRNVLVESSRISRGDISPLSELKVGEFDAVIFPGGFGAAKNLSSFAFEGDNCTVNQEVTEVVKKAAHLKIPIGALCITPVLIAKVLGKSELTIGNDETTEAALIKMGASHKLTSHGEIVIDKDNKIVSSPCYMLDANILQIAEGIDNLVNAVFSMN
jgi:enhancing lycopene biosynthesis protein 2